LGIHPVLAARIRKVSATTTFLVSTVVLALTSSDTAADQQGPVELEYRLPDATIEAPDQRTIDHLRQRPSTLRCNLVVFSIERLVSMILRIDSGELDVTDSSVILHLFDNDAVRFTGFYASRNQHEGKVVSYEWVGELATNSYFKATFVLSSDLRLDALIDTPEGVFSLSHSNWSGNQFLCELDPSQLPRKID
jgi:hypothetical protein